MNNSYLFPSLLIFLVCLYPSLAITDSSIETLYIPEGINDPMWHNERKQKQLESRNDFQIFYDFTFTDIQSTSGINFLHRIVDDAGKNYKAVHYDHGNGIAVADINGDDLLDIYLVTQVGPNALYQNLGNGKFKDITDVSGTAVKDVIGVSASFADIDNDGDDDLYVTNVRSPNVLFENLGDGKFKDISKQSGLDFSEHSSAATFFDFDRDGKLDVFVAVVGEYTTNSVAIVEGTVDEEGIGYDAKYYVGHKDAFAGHLHKRRQRMSHLFRNLGNNQFEDVTESTQLMDYGWTGDATAIDLNNDGWQDLYVLSMQGLDQYWENQNGKIFINKTDEYFPNSPWGAMGVKSLDFDNDGLMDLMISDMHSDMSEKIGLEKEKLKANWIRKNWSPNFLKVGERGIYGNALFKKSKDGSYKEVSGDLNVENYWPWGISVADLNADSWQDLLLTSSMNYPFRYAPNSLLLNNKGRKFLDAEYIVGIEPRIENKTNKPWFQLDCVEKDKKNPICKKYNNKVIVNGALGTRSSVIFDLDNDGDLDIVTNEFGDVPQVLLSNLLNNAANQAKANYLKIKLIGDSSNKNALGAVVKLTLGDNTKLIQVNDGKSGYLSQSSMPLYFGLGENQSIDNVEVIWPNGKRRIYKSNIKINALNKLNESSD